MGFSKYILSAGLALVLQSSSPEGLKRNFPPGGTGEQLSKNTVIKMDRLVRDTSNGILLLNGNAFTGTAIGFFPNGRKSKQATYKNGIKHGQDLKWFPDGMLSYEANYVKGQREGTVTTWWKTGGLRSESLYLKGRLHGLQRQWYASGGLFKEMNMIAGRAFGMQRSWRENGKIYNNYEVKNGRIFGLKRATLCYSLEDENVQL